jgi:predicted phosphoribosyltransferase
MVRIIDAHHRFPNRREAGRELARQLAHYKGRRDLVVLALPRGGVPVGYEIARELAAPLDVFVVRKLGLPEHPEFAIGAIASGGVRILNDEAVRWYEIPPEIIDAVARKEEVELKRREAAYRDTLPPVALEHKVVVLVDDGLATGSTMKAAIVAVRKQNPSKIVIAAPVGAPDSCAALEDVADEVVCARAPEPFSAVGLWYLDFSETSDDEVRTLLREERQALAKLG